MYIRPRVEAQIDLRDDLGAVAGMRIECEVGVAGGTCEELDEPGLHLRSMWRIAYVRLPCDS